MECDSVHSTLEKKFRGKPIYSPHIYVELMAGARPVQKYCIRYITHQFFTDFKALTYYSSIRPGFKVGDPVVTDMCSLKYTPNGTIQYKLRFDDAFGDLPKRATRRADQNVPGDECVLNRLHESPLHIKSSKYKHLQELKAVIPADYHGFYDSLPHK